MKKFSFLLCVLSCSLFIAAQDAGFLLYSFKGNVSVIENKTEAKAKVGKMMTSASTIKIANGAAATIICNEAAMFTISKPGTYNLSQFGDSCKVSSSSLTSNYVKYVWAQMTKTGGSPGSDRKKYMNTVGAVSRSVNNVWIDPRLDTVNYSGGDFPLSWKSYADAKEFDFSIYNGSTTPIYKTTVTKKKIALPKIISQLKPGNSYTWTASVKGEQNDEMKTLNYISKEKFEQVLADFKNQTAYESAAEQAYRIAFMLEDAHYLSEAYQYYSKAAVAAPDNPLYRSTLMSFKKDYEIK